jgi:hypothetical protein
MTATLTASRRCLPIWELPIATASPRRTPVRDLFLHSG